MKILIKNANIFNGEDNKIYNNQDILIEDNRISKISNNIEENSADKIIDATGKTVMPGMIDAHIHIMLYQQADKPITYEAVRASVLLKQVLSRGFTTIRDVGGEVSGIARALNEGIIDGPRMYYSGKVLSQTGGHGDMRQPRDINTLYYAPDYSDCSGSIIADGVDAVRRAARVNFTKGASFVKIMASGGCKSPLDSIYCDQFSMDELRAAVEVAESYHTYAAAHAYTPGSITRCIESGVRSIEHGNFLDKATANLMAEKKAYLVPTLIAYNLPYNEPMENKFLVPYAGAETISKLCKKGLEAIINAREAGVKIGFGTDIVKEDSVFDKNTSFSEQCNEFLLRSEIETPYETLHSATAVNAEILNMKNELGVIKEGAIADLLVIDGNPLEDITLVTEQGKNFSAIIQNGNIIKNDLQ